MRRKPKPASADELREQVAALKNELADEHHCRTAYDKAASKRLAALEEQVADLADCIEALKKLASDDEPTRNSGHLHMLRRSLASG